MTLLDAPKFDAEKVRRRSLMLVGFLGGFFLLLVVAWFVVGHPIEAPWNWWTYWSGERTTDHFLHEVETNDIKGAYATWVHDEHWQQHPGDFAYPYDRFAAAFGPDSQENDYGTITSHQIVAAKIFGGDLIVGAMMNGRKSHPLFLIYDRKAHTLGFSPRELSIDR
jgi:hypothetical protein